MAKAIRSLRFGKGSKYVTPYEKPHYKVRPGHRSHRSKKGQKKRDKGYARTLIYKKRREALREE